MERIRVLVVDDSRFMVSVISSLLEKRDDLVVVGHALDGEGAIKQAKSLRPDVITMDVVMPRVDGIEATRQITAELGIPIVILSAYTDEGARLTLDAMQAGALECIAKPEGELSMSLDSVADEIVAKVRRAAAVMRQTDAVPAAGENSSMQRTGQFRLSMLGTETENAPLIVAIGASTGGIQALNELLPRFPSTVPYSILVVQHFPSGLTGQLERRLDSICNLPVREVESGMRLNRAWIYITPGGRNVEVSGSLRLRLTEDTGPSILRPSIDAAFRSVASVFGDRCVGVILTGMGDDGAQGAAAIRRAGGIVLVQDPATATAQGMPRAAVSAGVSDIVLPLNRLSRQLLYFASEK